MTGADPPPVEAIPAARRKRQPRKPARDVAQRSVVSFDAGGYRPRHGVESTFRVTVNGESRDLEPGTTVAGLVAALGLGPRRIAVELNRAVVPRAEYGATALHAGDAVEIIHFVGGG